MRAIVDKLPLFAILAVCLSYASIADAAGCDVNQCKRVYDYCVSTLGNVPACEARRARCEDICGFSK